MCTIVLLSGCDSGKIKPEEINYSEAALMGKQLSEKYCTACHLKPDPSLLTKETWRTVLPLMQTEMNRSSMKIFYIDWINICTYYDEGSLVKMPKGDPDKLENNTSQFKENTLFKAPKDLAPNLTLVAYLDENLFLGNELGELFQVGETETKIKIDNIPIDVEVNTTNKNLYVLGIGNIYPSREKKGQLIKIDSSGISQIIIDSLCRPVHFIINDFNDDGHSDFLISSFGAPGEKYSGKLSLFLFKEGLYEEHVIKALPGALKTIIGDFNNDSKIDIMALFSQGREAIIMFLNKGNLEFEEKLIAEFPPVYGTSDFTITDINNDSYFDIVCTNGDNGDYSPVFKNYHGVRVLINNKNNVFEEQYFYPINGASQVIAHDFDKDNDVDLVVLASFPNLADYPQESLVYFENTDDVTFNPSYIEEQPSGKWLRMDVGDLDNDGYLDLIVGANLMKTFNMPALYEKKLDAEQKSLLILKNQGKK